MIIQIFLIVFILYILFGKIIPYLLYPNYFISPKTVLTKKTNDIAKPLKSHKREKTIYNIYHFVINQYNGVDRRWSLEAFFKLFKVPDYRIDTILNKKEYFYCHTQNKVFIALLLSSGQFSEKQITIKKEFIKTPAIHQYVVLDFDKFKIKVDPYYRILQKIRT